LLVAVAGVAAATPGTAAAQCGKAAWYDLDGMTASGERADGSALAAAHRTLPFGTKVRVENLSNGREVVVRVNDRGPFVGGRVIDVSRAAAEKLGMVSAGIAKVRVSVIDGEASLDASCDDPEPRVLTAEAVADDAARAKAPEPKAAEAAPAPEGEPSDRQTAAVEVPAEPGTIPAAEASPDEDTAKPSKGTALVATVQYDEGSGEPSAGPARAKPASSDSAAFTEDPQLDDLEDAKIVASVVDIPLPRPRPPVFNDAPPMFNRQLALRFLDAFAPEAPGMRLDVPLGYAPDEPRGAVITE
jgi:rare lipoprotein A